MTALDSLASPPLKDAATIVREIAPKAGLDGIEYRDALTQADKRGFVPFILFATVLLLLPIDIVLPQVAAATLIVCGLGLFAGARAPWLPGFLGKRKINQLALEKFANFLQGQQSWLHWLVSPRHPEFALGVGERLAALGLVLLGASVAAPLPDAVPAFGALAIGLGLLQRDGLVLMIGTAVAIGWTAFLATMIAGLVLNTPFAGGWGHDHAAWLVDRLAPSAPLTPAHP